MKSILFPFVHDTDFKAGYAWSLELAERLKCRLSIFTTTSSDIHQSDVQLSEQLVDAQTYLHGLGLSTTDRKSKSVVHHFLKGDFGDTLLRFVATKKFDVLVLPCGILTESILIQLIDSRKKIINLPSYSVANDSLQRFPTREAFFLEILYRATSYNLPSSFYKSFGDDKSLFNSIASFFKRPELDVSNLTAG